MAMNRVVVITGASEGIGAELAKRLGAQGDAVVLAARRAKELQQVADAIGSRAFPVVADVTQRAQVEALRDRALERFGHVDVWVNNAGRGIGVHVLDLTDEQVDEMLAVNLKSALYGMQAIVPHFQARGRGHLINISSVLSRVPSVTYRSIYSASKAALNTLTANLRMDLRAQYPNIHVTLVMPGVVTTRFAQNALGARPSVSPARIAAQTVQEAVEPIVNVIEHPVPEIYTNPASAEFVQRYFQNVAAFEEQFAAHAH
jgi:short-subunit dehydrogenase